MWNSDRFIYKILSAFGTSEYKKFIVLSRSRTGSTMLISLLNSHPNICAEGEIFSKLNGRRSQDVLAKVFSRQPRFIKARGFKIFYYHPQDDKKNRVWDDLIDMTGLSVIHLKRRNILRTALSRKLASVKKAYIHNPSNTETTGTGKTLTFTPEELEQTFRATRTAEIGGDRRFKKNPLLTLYYEDLAADPAGSFRKITEFLELKYVEPQTEMRKQNPESLRNLIANYDELKAAFSGSEWLPFFEE
jgi:LPS sulfotransferase NodH